MGFELCAQERRAERERAALTDVTYGDKLTSSQMTLLAEHVRKTFRKQDGVYLLSYEGMRKLQMVLCRWPRPSELRRLVHRLSGETPEYHHLSVVITAESGKFGRMIGRSGANLIRLTKQHKVSYMWLAPGSTADKRTLHIYGLERGNVRKCLKAVRDGSSFKFDKEKETVVKSVRDMDVGAVPFFPTGMARDSTQNLHRSKPLSPTAKQFTPENV